MKTKENDIKIHKLEERINDLELEMKAEEVGQAGANQLIQERLEKLEAQLSDETLMFHIANLYKEMDKPKKERSLMRS